MVTIRRFADTHTNFVAWYLMISGVLTSIALLFLAFLFVIFIIQTAVTAFIQMIGHVAALYSGLPSLAQLCIIIGCFYLAGKYICYRKRVA
jgi:hypothetical protein